MTPAEIKKTRLYRTLAPCVRKEDREELARMLAMAKGVHWNATCLCSAFIWSESAQGSRYWRTLSARLHYAGHECW